MNKQQFEMDMIALVTQLIPTIGDDYRATEDPNDETPGMALTIGADVDGWSYQTGDNSFTGGAYGYQTWGLASAYRDSDPTEVMREIVSSLEEAHSDTLIWLWDPPTYAVEPGRAITRDGVPIVHITRVGNDSDGHALAPYEADELTRDIAAALNLMGALKRAGFGTDEDINGADIVDLINEHIGA